jgi:hypothetical protein
MPVEYSGAAYRFGHSMIRAEYEVQDGHTVPIFGQDGYEDLRGNRQIPSTLWIDWNYFFEIPGMNTPDDRDMARLIDSQISLPLTKLPPTVVAPTAGAIVALAERNLLRGKRLGLPAGQDVAVAMGIKPLTNAQLGLTEPGWKNKAPLWFYILKESELLGGKKLGPVGGWIVAEVILGLLGLDKTSYFNANPSFTPGPNYKMATSSSPPTPSTRGRGSRRRRSPRTPTRRRSPTTSCPRRSTPRRSCPRRRSPRTSCPRRARRRSWCRSRSRPARARSTPAHSPPWSPEASRSPSDARRRTGRRHRPTADRRSVEPCCSVATSPR